MSLGLPTLRPRVEANTSVDLHQNQEYDVPKQMHTGLNSTVRDGAHPPTHPLQYSEEHWMEQREKINMNVTRNMQGLHMPIRLSMERFAASQVGRLPCMSTKTSNLMLDTLTGNDEMINVEDVFNNPMEFPERMGNPHALMEKRLGIF